MTTGSDAARMDLEPDAWHQTDEGNYYIDCPECGSPATLMNVVGHGRCNGYLDDRKRETEIDETATSCTAKLSLELVYSSDPDASGADEAVGESEGTDEGSDTGGDTDETDPDYDDSPAPAN